MSLITERMRFDWLIPWMSLVTLA